MGWWAAHVKPRGHPISRRETMQSEPRRGLDSAFPTDSSIRGDEMVHQMKLPDLVVRDYVSLAGQALLDLLHCPFLSAAHPGVGLFVSDK